MNVTNCIIVEPYRAPITARIDDSKEATARAFYPNKLYSEGNPDITIIDQKVENGHNYVIAILSEEGAAENGLPGNRKVDDVIIAGVFIIKKFESVGSFSVPVSMTDKELAKYMEKFKEPEYYVVQNIDNSYVYIPKDFYDENEY